MLSLELTFPSPGCDYHSGPGFSTKRSKAVGQVLGPGPPTMPRIGDIINRYMRNVLKSTSHLLYAFAQVVAVEAKLLIPQHANSEKYQSTAGPDS